MKKFPLVIIDKNPTTCEVLSQYLEENKKVSQVYKFIDLKEGYDFICKEKTKLIFIDTAFGEDAVLNLANKIFLNDSECKIVMVGKHFSASLMIKYKKVGVKEFLQKPVIKKELETVVSKVVNQLNFDDNTQKAKVISIFSRKGGIGKTTIATNLALEIANITKEKTVIVDFDSQYGDVRTFLNIDSQYGLDYFLKNKDKLNKEVLLSKLPKYKKTSLYVLGDMFRFDEDDEIGIEDIQDILEALKSTFSYIIIDMSNVINLKSMKTFDFSDEILIPMAANMPNLRVCQRILDLFGKMAYNDENVKLILNRYVKNDEIKTENIKTILKKEVFAKLSNDYFSVVSAMNRGISVGEFDNSSAFAKDIQKLAYTITDNEV